MDAKRLRHASLPRVAWAGALLAGVLVLGAIALDSSWAGRWLLGHIAARAGRHIRIDGPVEAHLLSLTPYLRAERVTIDNPPWMPSGTMAHIGTLSLAFAPTLPGRPVEIRSLELDATTLALTRDAAGDSNWQWTPPGAPYGKALAIVHRLTVPDARVALDDAHLHLKFVGTVSAHDAPGATRAPPLRIEGSGMLNTRAVSFTLTGHPLALARRDQPYPFEFAETSSGSRLRALAVLPRPFNFVLLDASFDATGEDMKDLYFLTGVSLPNTGPYRLSGRLQRRPTYLEFSGLNALAGGSDLQGRVLIRPTGARSRLEAELSSRLLRLKDLGAAAAGRAAPSAAAAQLLLPDTALGLQSFRRGNAAVHLTLQRLVIGPEELEDVAAQVTLEHGSLVLAPLSATLASGQLRGQIRIDLTHGTPTVSADLSAAKLRLGELYRGHAPQPPLEGQVQARLTLSGHGDTIHELAATSSGQLAVVVPHGAVSASLADLAGLDLARALGVLLSKRDQETPVRCGILSLRAADGRLSVENLLLATPPALITGAGDINLDSERIDVTLRDQPAHLALVGTHVPIEIGGTLRHPAIHLQHDGMAKVGAAATLSALLTPVTAVLHFIDPQPDTADCQAVLAQGRRAGVDPAPAASAPPR
jgi:AsmA family protein